MQRTFIAVLLMLAVSPLLAWGQTAGPAPGNPPQPGQPVMISVSTPSGPAIHGPLPSLEAVSPQKQSANYQPTGYRGSFVIPTNDAVPSFSPP